MKKVFFIAFFFSIISFNLLIYIEKKPLIHEEPRRAIIAQEMLIRGNYIVPTVFAAPYVKKPPMQNWAIVLLSMKDRVVSNFADRFPSVLSLLLVGLLMFVFIKDKKVALIASLIAVSNYLMLYSYGNKSEPDLMLTFFTLVSFFFYVKGMDNLKNILLSSVFMGFGILTKGVSPLFFYPGIFLFIMMKKEDKFRLLKYLSLHFLFSLLLPLIWVALYYFYGDIANLFNGLTSQAVHRAKGDIAKVILHFVKFPVRIFAALIPWSFLLFFYKSFDKDKKDDLYYVSLLCFISSFLILAVLPGGRGRYFMPAVPYFAIFMGYLLKDFDFSVAKYEKKIVIFLFVLLVFAIGLQVFFGFYYQILFTVVIFLAVFFAYKLYKGNLLYEIALLNLIAFSLYVHVYDYYKVAHYYNYKEAAKKVVENVGIDLPLVVGEHWAIQLLFNYERLTGRLVYDEKVNRFDKFYYVSSKKEVSCEKVYELEYSKKSAPRLYFYKCQR